MNNITTINLQSNRLVMSFDFLSQGQYDVLTTFAKRYNMFVQVNQINGGNPPSYSNVTVNYDVEVGRIKKITIARDLITLVMNASIEEQKELETERVPTSI